MQKMRKLWKLLVFLVLVTGGCGMISLSAAADSVYDSPYVTFSSDGKAFTTNAGDTNYIWYEEGTTISTGISSSVRALSEGEHYYRVRKDGVIPIGKWTVVHKDSSCCHNSYPPVGVPYHNIGFGRKCCLHPYYSGWMASCADCGENITPIMIYMNRKAAESITSLDLSLDYYYLCPYCTNLEQGSNFGVHYCRDISWNRYQIRYDSNANGWVGGYMEPSSHMYNNETIYEGEKVTPQTKLNKNTYTRIGYEFIGWSTQPDGSGSSFTDQEEIWNLSTENYDETGGGTITLYAQWEKSESTLKIDPAGGSYGGNKGITEIKGAFGDSYLLDKSQLVAPDGFQIFFDTMGGNPIDVITGTMSFKEWILEQPFYGKVRSEKYYFLGTAGSEDTVRASYDYDAVTLPEAYKSGSSFGGWYYEPECMTPAGSAGDEIIPKEDITLYAKWVELVLYAEDNYTSNQGKGAVDLSWQQNDGHNKSYMIYQSKDNVNWTLVSDAEDISNSNQVDRTFGYSGTSRTYKVPYTGLYTLALSGAQGGNYGKYQGGYGGRVSGKVWLVKGEELTYNIGGSNGYNGGAKGNVFANGGGCTTVSSNLKGLLFVAGGGGGASSLTDGGAGGSQAGNLSSGISGESGDAGGGGGYFGGLAGQVVYHYHSDQCYRVQDTSFLLMSNPDYLGQWAKEFGNRNINYSVGGNSYAYTKNIWGVRFHGKGDANSTYLGVGEYYDENYKLQYQLIPINGSGTLNIHMSADLWVEGQMKNSVLTVWDQNNKVIFSKGLDSVTRYSDLNNSDQKSIDRFLAAFEQRTGGNKGTSSGWYDYYADVENDYDDHAKVYWNEKVTLPEGTTGVRVALWTNFSENAAWISSTVHEISFSGSKKIQTCAYEKDGQLVSSTQAYGGSNYVNTQYVSSYVQETGKKTGNGTLSIQSVKTGYVDSLYLNGVTAVDCDAPDKVDETSVRKNGIDESSVILEWEQPKDNGTPYYHRAESYRAGSTEVLSQSNVTVNTLTSQIAGFYYIVNQKSLTKVQSGNGTFVKEPCVEIMLTEDKQFIHVAAVDKAGNVGETIHVQIGRKDEEVAWPLRTEQIKVSSAKGSVYEQSAGVYYVKCDAVTPFSMQFGSVMAGEASLLYQINHSMFYMKESDRDFVAMDIESPMAEQVADVLITADAAKLIKTFTGKSVLKDASYTITRRSEWCRKLDTEQRFTMDSSMNGKRLQVVPVAGADFEGELVTSDWNSDLLNGVLLIGDNVAPAISGVEEMQQFLKQASIWESQSFILCAEDQGSGVQDFYVVITNRNNGNRRKYSETAGSIEILFSQEDTLFQGDLTVELYAVDRVGNENIISCVSDNFTVTGYVERLLEPHEPVFSCGESGRLIISSYGYVDRVEVTFPRELTDLNPDLNITYTYDGTAYQKEEEYEFMIPLGTPLSEYTIMVNAWKDGELKSCSPMIWTLGEEESVLKDIRTRLR